MKSNVELYVEIERDGDIFQREGNLKKFSLGLTKPVTKETRREFSNRLLTSGETSAVAERLFFIFIRAVSRVVVY